MRQIVKDLVCSMLVGGLLGMLCIVGFLGHGGHQAIVDVGTALHGR